MPAYSVRLSDAGVETLVWPAANEAVEPSATNVPPPPVDVGVGVGVGVPVDVGVGVGVGVPVDVDVPVDVGVGVGVGAPSSSGQIITHVDAIVRIFN
jgi:hypothetical protein